MIAKDPALLYLQLLTMTMIAMVMITVMGTTGALLQMRGLFLQGGLPPSTPGITFSLVGRATQLPISTSFPPIWTTSIIPVLPDHYRDTLSGNDEVEEILQGCSVHAACSQAPGGGLRPSATQGASPRESPAIPKPVTSTLDQSTRITSLTVKVPPSAVREEEDMEMTKTHPWSQGCLLQFQKPFQTLTRRSLRKLLFTIHPLSSIIFQMRPPHH